MKKIIATSFFATSFLTSFAQDNASPAKVYHHEFGIDATGFITQFLNTNNGQFASNYTPTYYLTYRKHFKTGNIRFGLGGSFSNQDVPAISTQDSNKYFSHSYSFDARIGWEFFNDLNKHWQVFYGLDFRPSSTYYKSDNVFSNSGYANGIETRTQAMGFAPLLGFRFKLTSRLSITTEANFSINFSQSTERDYFTSLSGQYPLMPDITKPKIKKMYSSFSQPLSVILTFDI
ncbi:MAG: hypothetical protein ABI378_03120 [Chitinophagaceae bacterium]